MAASFSRLQLAAALLEYDNDPDNPEAPRRSAQDSAIFAHLRRANKLDSSYDRRSTDYLAVTLPTDAASVSAMNDTRRSRSSIAALQNMFGAEGEEEEEPPAEEEIEVDLESWGLDSFIPKEKGSKSKAGKKRDKLDIIPNPHPASPVATTHQTEKHHSRSMSFGNFGTAGAFLESRASTLPANFRRNSIANPLDTSGYSKAEIPPRKRWVSDHILMEDLPVRPPLLSSASFTNQERDTIPFPVSYTPDDRSEARLSRPASAMMIRTRAQSNATMGSGAQELDEANPFSIRPPSPSRASRFDPKVVAHARALSNATMLTSASRPLSGGQDLAMNRAPHHDAVSMRSRRMSNASWGTRNMLDDDFEQPEEAYGRDGHYSRMALMRPKVLIMPSPLQSAEPPKPIIPNSLVPPGFRSSTADPTSSAAAQPMSSTPIASNSFTPNPRLSLSASQLLFRNTLIVGGERDISYGDIDGKFQRATEDGEKIEWPEEEVAQVADETVAQDQTPVEDVKPNRPPGKLYGRSLIDDLESRKAAQKAKQRVFTGDQRPSMMDRKQLQRSSTLIDPASLQQSPTMKDSQSPLQRRGSKLQPLLNFEKEGSPKESGLMPNSNMPRGKSVFGVDTLWEREMAKLKEIEAQEKKDKEEQMRKEEEEEAKRTKKKKKKSKGKDKEPEPVQVAPSPATASSPPQPSSPPVLPEIQRAIVRRKPTDRRADDESDDDSSASEIIPSHKSIAKTEEGQGWVSEDEDQPKQAVRSPGVGPRYQVTRRDDDSDEDVPLSVTLQRALNKMSFPGADDDSDEDKPIAALINRSQSMAHSEDRFTAISNSASPARKQTSANDDEDDDVPLGVRASKIPPLSQSFQSLPPRNDDDDDRPLGMHPQQQRRTQYQLFSQQQQQQQALLQAQMRNTMAFGATPSIYGSVLTPFAPPMQSPMMPVMMAQPFNPPPPQDTANYGKIDRWRRDVAIDGSQ